ncbi:hypothetical protein SynBIOSU31_01931 [Synechococcus sp. BIOS-U3-1]|nr:hypothetical protein SynBIOSU31_01931 [Synechococcus sp. BIOS-U3-1]
MQSIYWLLECLVTQANFDGFESLAAKTGPAFRCRLAARSTARIA